MHKWKLHGKLLQKAWACWLLHTAFFQAAHLSRACSHHACGRGPGRSLIQRYSCCIPCCIHSCIQESQQPTGLLLVVSLNIGFHQFPCPFMLFSLITITIAFQVWVHTSGDPETELREKQRYRQTNLSTWKASIGNFLLGILIHIEKLGLQLFLFLDILIRSLQWHFLSLWVS